MARRKTARRTTRRSTKKARRTKNPKPLLDAKTRMVVVNLLDRLQRIAEQASIKLKPKR
jgi:hypothetical protein